MKRDSQFVERVETTRKESKEKSMKVNVESRDLGFNVSYIM